ncbi:MAG: efflux RND transporter periplasmic adaptor subunit [Thioalkalispiraceae bacterium]|jgi:multidrug efflux system membrane fusion protein
MKKYSNMKEKYLTGISCLLMVLYSSYSWSAEYDAVLNWSQRTELGTVVSGIVDKVNVEVGDRVSKGDSLVQLDDSVFRARVAEYKAKLASVEEELKEAERERDRAIELYERTVLSQHDLQMAKNGYIRARAKYENARAALAARKYELKYSAIRAPFAAVVLIRNAQPGQIIATEYKQEPLISIAVANKMLATMLVSKDKIANIKKGKAAKVEVGGRSFSGTITLVGLEPITAKDKTNGYPVEVEFDVGEVQLRSGLAAKVTIE